MAALLHHGRGENDCGPRPIMLADGGPPTLRFLVPVCVREKSTKKVRKLSSFDIVSFIHTCGDNKTAASKSAFLQNTFFIH